MGRQAQLRPEYADWYPRVVPAQWQSAVAVRRIVLRQLRRGSPYWHPEPRVLSDAHFEFRDTSSKGAAQVRVGERRVVAYVPPRSPLRTVGHDRPAPGG